MPVMLKDIKGVMIEENKCPIHGLEKAHPIIGGCNCYEIKIENDTLTQQGSVKITHNRERLVEILHDLSFNSNFQGRYGLSFTVCRYIADAIISDESEFLEVVTERKI